MRKLSGDHLADQAGDQPLAVVSTATRRATEKRRLWSVHNSSAFSNGIDVTVADGPWISG